MSGGTAIPRGATPDEQAVRDASPPPVTPGRPAAGDVSMRFADLDDPNLEWRRVVAAVATSSARIAAPTA